MCSLQEISELGRILELKETEVKIGRGPFLGVTDKRVSRSHGTLKKVENGVRLESCHINPCFYSRKSDQENWLTLEKGQTAILHPGDQFSLLPKQLIYKVVGTDVSDENIQKNHSVSTRAGQTPEKSGGFSERGFLDVQSNKKMAGYKPLTPQKNNESETLRETLNGSPQKAPIDDIEVTKSPVKVFPVKKTLTPAKLKSSPNSVNAYEEEGKEFTFPTKRKRKLPNWMTGAKVTPVKTPKNKKLTPARTPKTSTAKKKRPEFKPLHFDSDLEDDESGNKQRKGSEAQFESKMETHKDKSEMKSRAGTKNEPMHFQCKSEKRGSADRQKTLESHSGISEKRTEIEDRTQKTTAANVQKSMIFSPKTMSKALKLKKSSIDSEDDFIYISKDGQNSKREVSQENRSSPQSAKHDNLDVTSEAVEMVDASVLAQTTTEEKVAGKASSSYDTDITNEDLPVAHDEDDEKTQTRRNDSSHSKSPSVTSQRESCGYGSKCYRKNPLHLQEFSHPGDPDYVDQSESDDGDSDLPECPYGINCYRKNPLHQKQFKHSRRMAPKRAARQQVKPDSDDDTSDNGTSRQAKKKRPKRSRHDDESSPDDYDYDNSFLNGDSDDDVDQGASDEDDEDWDPSKDSQSQEPSRKSSRNRKRKKYEEADSDSSTEEEDLDELVADAKKFSINKKMWKK